MSRVSLGTLALAGLLFAGVASTVRAQDAAPVPMAGPRGQQRMDPDRQLQRLTRALSLSADQQAQIKPLLVDRQQKIQALMSDQSLAPQDRRARARSIANSARTGILAVLNDDQKQKFEALQERMRSRGERWNQNAAPDPAPAPAPQPQS